MSDLYFTESGDIALNSVGDIATTASYDYGPSTKGDKAYIASARHYSQQAFIRLMTESGDYTMYPNLGASLEDRLAGLPNTPETAEFGKSIILASLRSADSPLLSISNPTIKAVPIGPQAIRFDIYLTIGSRTELALSIQQKLNTVFALEE
jgi:hypothetical protein